MRIALIVFVLLLIQCQVFAQSKFEGYYVAAVPVKVSEMGGMERAFAEEKKIDTGFYTILYLKIKGDTAYFDHHTTLINDADTMFLKSDGIYKYFDGIFSTTDSTINFTFKEVVVNYFEQTLTIDSGNIMEVRRRYEMGGKLLDGGILIGNILLKKTNAILNLFSEKPALFRMKN